MYEYLFNSNSIITWSSLLLRVSHILGKKTKAVMQAFIPNTWNSHNTCTVQMCNFLRLTDLALDPSEDERFHDEFGLRNTIPLETTLLFMWFLTCNVTSNLSQETEQQNTLLLNRFCMFFLHCFNLWNKRSWHLSVIKVKTRGQWIIS